MALLSREQILAVDDRRKEKLEVPEWGGEVFLVSMNGKERLEYEAALQRFRDGDKTVDFMGELLIRAMRDEGGAPLFTVADLSALAERNPAVMLRVFSAAAKLNALTEEAASEQAGNS